MLQRDFSWCSGVDHSRLARRRWGFKSRLELQSDRTKRPYNSLSSLKINHEQITFEKPQRLLSAEMRKDKRQKAALMDAC